jgi:cytochrome c oxidase assembly protein subunit 15
MRVALQKIPQEYHHHMHRLRRFTYFNMALVGVTALSGAFVAGNDAGRAYNTFPMMGNEWIPSEILVLKPLWRNLCENTATVQFDHRTLALLTLSSVTACYMTCRTVGQGILWSLLPVSTKLAFNSIISIAYLQVGLGITTLLLYVPVPLAVLHQVSGLLFVISTSSSRIDVIGGIDRFVDKCDFYGSFNDNTES